MKRENDRFHDFLIEPKMLKRSDRISFKEISPPPLETKHPDVFGKTETHGYGKPSNHRIFMHKSVYRQLKWEINFSSVREEGGFCIGNPSRLPESAEVADDPEYRWMIEITDIIPAQETCGTSGMLLFTCNTWSLVTRRIDEYYPCKKMLGWYHTHIFSSDGCGLSALDQNLHRKFMTQPWQAAILINLNRSGDREVRCFQRTNNDGDLHESAYEVITG